MIEDRTSYDRSFFSTMRYLKRSGRVLRLAKILGTIFGATMVALSPWVSQQEMDSAQNVADIMLWTGASLTLFGSLVLVFVDDTAPDILSENLELARQQEINEHRFDFLDDFIDHALTRVSLNSYLREVIEQAVTEGCQTEEDLARFSDAVLGFLVARKTSLFGIDDEAWNFAVYRYRASTNNLGCLACKRAGEIAENHEHRTWAVGEGHVGLSFSRANELVFSDATKPALRPVIGAKGHNARESDEKDYKSLAAMPISLDGDQPLGILVATSDRVGRFKDESERGDDEWEREDVLRETAAYLAILFKLIHDIDQSGGPKNDEDKDAQ